VAFKPGGVCDETSLNGYYRLETRCIPCPCARIAPHHIAAGLFVLAVAILFALDLIGDKLAEHASTVAAPVLIAVSFCQSLAVLIDTDIPWPQALRDWLVLLGVFNFNIELVHPECSIEFGAMEKVQSALFFPLLVLGVLTTFAAMKLLALKCNSTATKPQQRAARNKLWRKLVTVATTVLTVGTIFFVKSFLRAFDCVALGSDSTTTVMESAPEIECSDSDPDYPAILRLSAIGLTGFASAFACLCVSLMYARHSQGVGGFSFISDRYEESWFYWELVLVVRKALYAAAFLLFETVFAVLRATAITIVSLCLHVLARPFQDSGTDWTELCALVGQLFMLVAGPVFKVLSQPGAEATGETAEAFRNGLDAASVITILIGLAVSLIMEVHIVRSVASAGTDEEHEDYRVRMEARRLEAIRRALDVQASVVEELKEAHKEREQEMQELERMQHHEPSSPDAKAGSDVDADAAANPEAGEAGVERDTQTFENPLSAAYADER
jgi:hypothetical protein